MKKKVRLEYSEDYDFYILGIVSFDKDYRFIWNINEALETNFARIDNHRTIHKKTQSEQTFSCFFFEDPDSYIQYRILSNKGESGYLLDTLKNIDFLLLIKGDLSPEEVARFKTKLQRVENVHAVFNIDGNSLKNPQRLLTT